MTESDNNNEDWPNYDAREPQQSSLAGKVRRLIAKKMADQRDATRSRSPSELSTLKSTDLFGTRVAEGRN